MAKRKFRVVFTKDQFKVLEKIVPFEIEIYCYLAWVYNHRDSECATLYYKLLEMQHLLDTLLDVNSQNPFTSFGASQDLLIFFGGMFRDCLRICYRHKYVSNSTIIEKGGRPFPEY